MRNFFLGFLAMSIAGCGGAVTTAETTNGSGGGAGATVGGAGAAGIAASGGSGGGGAGTTGASGSGGGAVADASVGAGGSSGGASVDAGIKPECTSDKDCRIFADCCSCEGVPISETPASCPVQCNVTSHCAALGLVAPQAACVAGRCIVGFDCDRSQVLCRLAPPQCPPGQAPLVANGCWQGSCVPANECASVPDCALCGNLICARFPQRGGSTMHCYDVPKECNGDYGCACAGAAICSGPGLQCGDLSGLKGIVCSCPAC